MGLKWVHEIVSRAFDFGFTNFRRTDGRPFSTHILAARPTVSNSLLESLTSETRASVFCFVSLTIFIAANLTEYSYHVNTFSDLFFPTSFDRGWLQAVCLAGMAGGAAVHAGFRRGRMPG